MNHLSIHPLDWTLPAVLAWALIYFLTLYVGFSGLIWVLAKLVDRPIETKPVRPKQIRFELFHSFRSVILFSLGMVVPWAMIKAGIVDLDADPGPVRLMLEILVLVAWNDLHFYALHRLLHTKLRSAHAIHHRSLTATPFASYSMSITEALLLGSVMPIAMLAHSFSIQALLFLPLWSICINALAHSNCDFFPRIDDSRPLGFIRRHQSHHSSYHGNYSFFFAQLDHWFGTDPPSPPKGTR